MMEFIKSLKTKWLILPFSVIVLMISIFIWLQNDFLARLSLLINLYRSDHCMDLSSSGKWLRCSLDFDDKPNAVHMDILSTDFPFQKITVDLPDYVRSTNTISMFYDGSWSPAGDTLSVEYGLFEEKGLITFEFCVVQMTNNGSYEIDCLPKDLLQNLRGPSWSISGNSFFDWTRIENEGPVITVISPKAEVIQRIDIPTVTKINPVDFEHASMSYLGNEFDIYFSITNNADENGNQLEESSEKTKFFRIPISRPSETTLLSEVPGAWEIVSIDPQVSQLLLRRYSSSFYETYFDFLRMDILSGEILDQIRMDAPSEEPFLRQEVTCSINCSETAFRLVQREMEIMSVWSWKTMSLSHCPFHDTIIGHLNTGNGFIDTVGYFEMKGPIKLSACQ